MKIRRMNLVGVHMQKLYAAMRRMLSAVSIGGLVMLSAWAEESANSTPSVPPRPARRVRRRYDAPVQLHVPGTVEELPKTEKQPSVSSEDKDFRSDSSLLAPSALPSSTTPGQVVHIRQPKEKSKDKRSDDDLWITLPAGTLLGVNLVSSESPLSVSWGWLADDSKKIRHEEKRKPDAEFDEIEDDEEDAEEELPVDGRLALNQRSLGGALMAAPQDRAAGLANQPSSSGGASPPQMPTWSEIRLSSKPEQARSEGFRSDVRSPAPNQATGMDRVDTEPWFSGLGRRVTEIAEIHRSAPGTPTAPNTQDWVSRRLDPAAPSFDSRWTREEAAAIGGVPLLSGSHENYGRRGDIFSPSFQSTSSSLPGSAPSRSLWSESTFSPPSAPSTIEPVRSTISEGAAFPSMRDVIRPFDPAGRVWTDMNRPR
ncbi:hypothetical protein [Thermosphaera sp.]